MRPIVTGWPNEPRKPSSWLAGSLSWTLGERPRVSVISRRGSTGLPYLSYLVDRHWSPWQSTGAFWFFTSMANSPRGPSRRWSISPPRLRYPRSRVHSSSSATAQPVGYQAVPRPTRRPSCSSSSVGWLAGRRAAGTCRCARQHGEDAAQPRAPAALQPRPRPAPRGPGPRARGARRAHPHAPAGPRGQRPRAAAARPGAWRPDGLTTTRPASLTTVLSGPHDCGLASGCCRAVLAGRRRSRPGGSAGSG